MKSNRRRRYIVAKQFQIRFIALIIMALVIAINAVIIALLSQPWFEQQVTIIDTAILGIVELILVCGAYYLAVRTSHRIAGPVYVLAHSLKRLADGDLGFRLQLRRNDYFKDFGDDANLSIERLRTRIVEMKRTMEALVAVLPQSSEARQLADQLQRQLADFRTDIDPHGPKR